MSNPVVWSYGGGVQSVAIGVLVAQGKLPVPDYAVIADTGREGEGTWEYLRTHMQPYLTAHGLGTVEIISQGVVPPVYDKKGRLLIPAYHATGVLPTFCSATWKRDVILSWKHSRGLKACDMWLGITLDEIHRARRQDRRGAHYVYPLLTLLRPALTRADCLRLVETAGLPRPPKSACWMCPFRTNVEWRELSPGDWRKAVAFDTAIRLREAVQGDPPVFLHRENRPLAEVNLDPPATPAIGQQDLFCEGGFCWV